MDYPDLINYPGGPEKVKAKLADILPLYKRGTSLRPEGALSRGWKPLVGSFSNQL